MCTSLESDCDSGFADTQRTSESDTDSSKTGFEYLDLELPVKTLTPSPSHRTRHYRRDFTTNNALNLLEECEFLINSKWEKLARNMGISLNERHRLRALAITQSLNCETALEEAIDMFQRASAIPVSWDMFVSRVENVDRLTAAKMRRKLGITATPKKLQKRCDSRILFHISGRMDPLIYVSHFAHESECDEIRLCCADKDTSALFINLDMLFKWRKRKGTKATYQALLEIFQKENDEKMIDLVLKYAENGHSIHSFESEDLKFPKVSNKDDIPELEKQHTEIKEKFAFLSLQIIKSLEKTQRPRHIAYYVTKTSRFQFESTDDVYITDIIAKTSSWFNIKVLRSLVNRFGNDDDRESLSHYEQYLLAYLQQSLFNIPAESFQSSNDTSDVTICYLKIPDEEVELLDLSGENVLQIERNLADYLGIPHEVFNLCQYRLGCIELVFSIPTTLYESLQKHVVLDRFKNEFRLTVDLQDILPSHLAKLYIPRLKPSVLTEESHVASQETVEDTIYLSMNDKGQQKKTSTCSITLTGKTGSGKSSSINTLLPECVRNNDEIEDTDSYFGSESDIQTDSDDDETYSSHKAYKIALSHGELDVAYTRIMLLGPAGAGKSSLKRGLMSKPFDSRMNSTIVADVQSVRHEWAQAGDQWRDVTPEDEVEELAQLLATVYNNPRGSQTHLSSELATTLFAGDMMPSNTDIPQGYDEEVKHSSVTSISLGATRMAKEMRSTEITQLKPQPFLHILDYGGQPAFLEVQPALLTSRTMFLLLFYASTDLNNKMRSVRYDQGNEITEGGANMTTLELMEGWMSNIHANLVKCDDKHALLEYPRVIAVFTRRDKLKASEKDRVTKTLEERLQDRHYSEVLGKHKVLIVDNTTSGQGKKEDNAYKYLRKEIDDFTSKKRNFRTPITWVLFRKVLQMIVEKESRNTITISEAVAVGKACEIKPEDVPKVLKFYHELGVVLFYPHIRGLGDKVILSPKWFVDCLGKVLTLEGREAYGKMWDLLKEKGILVQPLYATAWRGCDGVEPEEMIQLLVDFGLAAELETKQYYDADVKQFFVPAVLPTFTGDPSSAITPGYKLRATPLHITFSTGYVIPGFFTRLVTSMAMFDQRTCSLQFDEDIFRNRITFQFDVNDVTLTALPNVIHVDLLRYIPDSLKFTPIQKSCKSLQDLLKTCCQQVKEFLQFINVPIEKEFKFVCQECDSSSHPHYLLPSPDGISTACERKKRVYRNLNPKEAYWFPDPVIAEEVSSSNAPQGAQGKDLPSILKKSPEVYDVYKLLSKKSADWDDFARELKIDVNFRKILRQQGTTTSEEFKLESILNKWIESESSDVTWSNLFDVLERLQFLDIASNVKSYLERKEVIEKYHQKKDYTAYEQSK